MKAKKIGTWEHPRSGITTDYFLEGTQFVATVLESQLRAPEATVLRALVFDRLEHWISLEWFPIIEVGVEGDKSSDGGSLKVEAERYYLSRSPAGVLYKVDWDCEEIHRKAQMRSSQSQSLSLTKLPLGAPMKCGGRYGNGDDHLLDYSDDVWAALQSIIEGIGQLYKQIGALVKTRAGVQKLAATGNKVLLLQ